MIANNLEWLPDDFVCSPKQLLKVLYALSNMCRKGKYIDGHTMRYAADRCKEYVMSLIDASVDASVDEAGFDDLIDDLMEEQK